ncbi:Myosin-11 [Ceratocystis fimbriata CBS 114723]|uniref:Myosin-11 n=1 Tax=Ceratocystis fimbriata CBS 114723 TaxID=1035309 RepID=A0A2C5WW17_9PEZI|nr:Myosin-11 [Ceratocystis fimbriata CBS 114723]
MPVDDLPVALRRQRRKSTRTPQPQSGDSAPQSPRHSNRIRRLTSKVQEATAAVDAANTTISTFKPLTPAKSNTKRKSAARRRRSEPILSRPRTHNNASRTAPTSGSGRASITPGASQKSPEPPSGTMTFQPLRAVLEGRVLRRIKRSGLSEEMNTIEAENRRRKRLLREQLKDLKNQLELRDREIDELRNSTLNSTMGFEPDSRVLDLERQIEDLKNELNRSAMATPVDHKFDDWDMREASYSDDETELATELASNDNEHDDNTTQHIVHREDHDDHNDISDHLMDDHDDEFGNATIQSLACGTPARATQKQKAPNSNTFLTPPITSPAAGTFGGPSKTVSPETAMIDGGCQTSEDLHKANAAMQAVVKHNVSMAQDYSHEARMEQQLAALNQQMGEMLETMASYNRVLRDFKTQLQDYSIPVPAGSDREIIQTKISSLLNAVNAKTATLDSLNHSLHQLGFPGSDSHEIVDSIRDTFQTARLELEYLIEGEYELPDTSNSAEIFDMVLASLRDLSKRNKEDEEVIEQCHETENQLRRELAAASVSTAESHRQLAEAHNQINSRNAKITDLENDIQCLQSGIADRQHRLSDAHKQLASREDKITSLETDVRDLNNKITSHQSKLAEAQGQIYGKDTTIAYLESNIKSLQSDVIDHQNEVAAAQAQILQKGAKINELEGDVQRFQTDIADQAVQFRRLEQRIATLQQEKAEAEATIATQRETISQRDEAIQDLERRVDDLLAQTEALHQELQEAHESHSTSLAELMEQHASDTAALNQTHTAAVVQRDEQIAALGADISRLNNELAEAQATIAGLRRENSDLRDENDELLANVEDQRMQAATMIEAVREDLQVALQRSAKFLMAPPPPSPASDKRRAQMARASFPSAPKMRPTPMVLPKIASAEMTVDIDMDDEATIVA